MSMREKYDAFVIRNTPPCREVVRIHSHSLDESISPRRRFMIWWHSKSCLYCKRYFKQLESMKTLVKQHLYGQSKAAEVPPGLAERIKKKTKEQLDQS